MTGPIVVYELGNAAGRVSRQRMCGVCHTRIYNSNSSRPGIVVVRAGTLDRGDEIDVAAHIWVRRKQKWLTLPDGVPTWPEGAEGPMLMAAMARV